MKYLNSILFIITLFITGCSSSDGGGTTGTGGFRFAGTVVSDSGEPVSGVNVTLEEVTGVLIKSTTTAADGSFEFIDVSSSDAVIHIDKGRPTASEITVSIPNDKNTSDSTIKRRPDGKFEDRGTNYEDRPEGPRPRPDNSGKGNNNESDDSDNSADDKRPDNSGKGNNNESEDDDNSGSDERPEDDLGEDNSGSSGDEPVSNSGSGHDHEDDHSEDDESNSSGKDESSDDDNSGKGGGSERD